MCRKYTDINHVNLLLVSLIWRMVFLAFHLLYVVFCHYIFFVTYSNKYSFEVTSVLSLSLSLTLPHRRRYAYLMEVTTTHVHSSTQCYSLLSCPEFSSGHTYSSPTSHAAAAYAYFYAPASLPTTENYSGKFPTLFK